MQARTSSFSKYLKDDAPAQFTIRFLEKTQSWFYPHNIIEFTFM